MDSAEFESIGQWRTLRKLKIKNVRLSSSATTFGQTITEIGRSAQLNELSIDNLKNFVQFNFQKAFATSLRHLNSLEILELMNSEFYFFQEFIDSLSELENLRELKFYTKLECSNLITNQNFSSLSRLLKLIVFDFKSSSTITDLAAFKRAIER